ncbi:hypothetical protein LJB42_001802 [Komagataella kurtzmanii]|nr:hypothetical protein LJB42_001802 [Komagataella kurtzmanii]
MQFSVVATLALAGSALAAYSNVTYTYETTITDVVTELTTYCPEPTTFVHKNKTITVTAPTTLTITDCPCTISKTTKITTDVPPTTHTTTTHVPSTSTPASTHSVSTISHGGAAKAGVAGLAGVAAAAAYLL